MDPLTVALAGKAIDTGINWFNRNKQDDAVEAINQATLQAERDRIQAEKEAWAEYVKLWERGLAADKETRDLQLAAIKEAQERAIAAQTRGQDQSLAMTLGGAQTAQDIARWQQMQQQSQMLPYQAAQLSAMQALPQLQQYLGLPAYNLPTSFDTTPPPQVNLADMYQAMLGRFQTGQEVTQPPTTPSGQITTPSNVKATPISMTAGAAAMNNTTGQPAPSMLAAAPKIDPKESIYDLESLDSYLKTANSTWGDPTTVRNGKLYLDLPYQNALLNQGIQTTTRQMPLLTYDAATNTIKQGIPGNYLQPDERLKGVTEKINKATALGKTEDAKRYQDIYDFYTGKPISRDSAAIGWTGNQPTPETIPTPVTENLPQTQTEGINNIQSSNNSFSEQDIMNMLKKAYVEQPSQQMQLTPFTGQAFKYEESPIYKQQLSEGEANINRALAARGLSQGATGSMTLGDFYRKLNAEEAEKTYNRLLDQVKIGMGQPLTTGGYTGGNAGQNLTNISSQLSNAGQNLSSLYQTGGANLSNIYAQANPAQAYGNLGASAQSHISGLGEISAQGNITRGAAQAEYLKNYQSPYTGIGSLFSDIYNRSQSGGGFGTGSDPNNPFVVRTR